METNLRASLTSDTALVRPPNPFGVTKSDDFSDDEINAFWIEPGEISVEQLLAPTRRMPMQILGGKGSGKTHLLRRLALASRNRWFESLGDFDKQLPFLAVYVRCDGLNAYRFSGKSQTPEAWRAIFQYFLDLWLTHALLTQVAGVVENNAALKDAADHILAPSIWNIFTETSEETPRSLQQLLVSLKLFLREIDVALNNLPLTAHLDLRIRVTPSRLLFEVPVLLSECLPGLHSAMILYLLDEMENLSDSQQTYVNSLVRHRKGNCSFRLGARLYGIKTSSTLEGETNRDGSEFDTLQLDNFFRVKKSYRSFCENLCIRRLEVLSDRLELQTWGSARLHESFSEPSSDNFYQVFSLELVGEVPSQERPYFKKLQGELKKYHPSVLGQVAKLYRAEYPLLEKLNVFLFYKAWNQKADLATALTSIGDGCSSFIEGNKFASDGYSVAYQHFSLDMLAQLQRDSKTRVKYVGFSTYVHMSAGLPRNLLIILKNIYDWALFNGESPFGDKPISMDSQEHGVMEAASWFFDDARPKQDSEAVQQGVERLATLFREIRYSDKPSECSLSTFSASSEGLDEDTQRLVHLAVDWSMLIRHDQGQKDRNSARVDEKLQLSPMLCPRWELPLARRGALALTSQEMNAIFGSDRGKWEVQRRMRVARMNVPFSGTSDAAIAGLFGVGND